MRTIVPYAPGGTSDILARTLAVRVAESLGQQIVVENRPGANGVLGTDLVAKSTPDGCTLLLTDVSGLTSTPAVVEKLPFNAARDFAPTHGRWRSRMFESGWSRKGPSRARCRPIGSLRFCAAKPPSRGNS